MSQVTSHILDTSTGKPATGIAVSLLEKQPEQWVEIATGSTNNDGRVQDLLADGRILPAGIYKMIFLTGAYFEKAGIQTFYPWVEIVFSIRDSAHYHIPLLISAFGYNSYRGS